MQNFINIAEDKVKNLIIEILSTEWDLTAKKIFYRVKNQYHKNISYQAVFKALTEMAKKKIIRKQGYEYRLNPVWINEAANFYQDIKRSYESKPSNYITRILKEQSLTLEFKNAYDSMLKTLECAQKLLFLIKGDNYQAFSEIEHMPWIFCGGEEEHQALKEAIKKFNGVYVLCRGDTEGDRMVVNYLKQFKNIHILLGQDCAKDHDTTIAGNMVAQLFYPESMRSRSDHVYKKMKKNPAEAAKEIKDGMFDPGIKITAVITRNKEFARLKKRQFIEKFKKAGIEITGVDI